MPLNSHNSEFQVSKLIQDVIDWSGFKPAGFAHECGFQEATRIYAAQNHNRALGVDSYSAIIKRFPQINGDRFIRKSGPLLLEDLCEKQEQKIIQEIKPLVASGNDWQIIADERLRTIERLEKQNDMLLKMLDR